MAINYGKNLGPNAGQVAMDTQSDLQGLQAVRLKIQDQQQRQEAETRKMAARQEFGELLQGNDTVALSRVAAKNPELAQEFTQTADFQDRITSRPRIEIAKDVLTNRADARTAYTQRAQEIQQAGGNADQLINAVQNSTDEDLMAMAEKDLVMFDPNYARARASGGARFSPISLKDFTSDSVAKYEQTGNKADLERYNPKTISLGGVTYAWDSNSEEFKPAVDVTSDVVRDQSEALSTIEAKKQSRLDYTKEQSRWQNAKPQYRQKISAGRDNHNLLVDTVKELKKSLSAGSTKWGAFFSDLPASEARHVENLISTVQANTALNSLVDLKNSGGSLGATSESEIKLLSDKMGALDAKGQISEMNRVLDQIVQANKGANDRLQTAYDETDKLYSEGFEGESKTPERPAVQGMPSGFESRMNDLYN